MSRAKGIGDAVKAVNEFNRKYDLPIYSLDIYGQIDDGDLEWFNDIKKDFPYYIKYKGLVPFNKSTEVVSAYYALLFPTFYEGEGFAGTILDAYASGVPVIASDWRYNSEILEDGKTGLIFKTHNIDDLIGKLEFAYKNTREWNEYKINTVCEAKKYLPNNVVKMIEID